MLGRFRLAAVGLPLLAMVFLPDATSVEFGPTVLTGPHMSVTISATGTRGASGVEVPITVSCSLPTSPVAGMVGSGGGQVRLQQANPARTAVGASAWGWINESGTPGGDLGGDGFYQPISCDGSTFNKYTVLVKPDPSTVPLHGGPTGGTFAAEVCNFVDYNTTCASASGRFRVILTH